MLPTSCPNRDVLVAFDKEQLAETDRSAIESHLDEGCLICNDYLDNLLRQDSPVHDQFIKHPPASHLVRTTPYTPETAQTGKDGTPPVFPLVPGYEVLNELGKGGMGIVYRARHLTLNRIVALKMIRSGVQADRSEFDRFRTESEAVARLQHPHIVQIFEVGECNNLPFFSLEFCPGGSLQGQLGRTLWQPDAAARLVETLARAMQHAHDRGIVHRDLKPANVLLTEDGVPKVSDFGLAKMLDDVGQTATNVVMGTPSYMAPEQAGDLSKDVGPAADIYALGAILFECLTGRPPFKAATPLETMIHVREKEPVAPRLLNPEAPRDLETICLKCLSKRPVKRYKDALALADDLRRWRAGEPIHARPTGHLERVVKWTRRRPAIAALISALVFVTLLGIGGVLWKYLDAEERRIRAERAEGIARDAVKVQVQKTEIAERAERFAKEETKRANEEAIQKGIELRRAEGLVYAANIIQSYSLWESGRVRDARMALNACRWDYRGWEHRYLRRLYDETQMTLRGHTRGVFDVNFSPDGKILASASDDRTVKLWSTETGQEIRALVGHEFPVEYVAFSADGKRVISASQDSLKVWDTGSGGEITSYQGFGSAARFSPDGRFIARFTSDYSLRVQDAESEKILQTFPGLKKGVKCLCFSPDSKRIACAACDNVPAGESVSTVKIWDTNSGEEIQSFQGQRGQSIGCVCFSPDGRYLAASGGGDPGLISVWDLAAGKPFLTFSGGGRISFSPDGKRIAGVGNSQELTVRIWDAFTGRLLHALKGHTANITGTCFSPAGNHVASAGGDSTIKVWDAVRGQDPLVLGGHRGFVGNICFDPSGNHLTTAGAVDGVVKTWDAQTGEELQTCDFHSGQISRMKVSPNEKYLAVSFASGVKVFDSSNGQLLRNFSDPGALYTGIDFSSDSNRLVGAGGGALKLWDVTTGEEIRLLQGDSRNNYCVCYSPNGRYIAAGTGAHREELQPPGVVTVWDGETGQVLFTFKVPENYIHGVFFDSESKRVAATGRAGVKVWSLETGEEVVSLNVQSFVIPDRLSFSPDGTRIAAAASNQPLTIWDATSGHKLLDIKGGHYDVVFNLQGRLAYTAVQNVNVLDTAIGEDRLIDLGERNPVAGVGFSGDGKRIVIQSEKGAVRSWSVESGREIRPCKDAAPLRQKEALNPDESLRAVAQGNTVRVFTVAENRPSSELVFARYLNDQSRRLRWHRREAADNEKAGQKFAAAFHLRMLIAAGVPDAEELKDRLSRCEDAMRRP